MEGAESSRGERLHPLFAEAEQVYRLHHAVERQRRQVRGDQHQDHELVPQWRHQAGIGPHPRNGRRQILTRTRTLKPTDYDTTYKTPHPYGRPARRIGRLQGRRRTGGKGGCRTGYSERLFDRRTGDFAGKPQEANRQHPCRRRADQRQLCHRSAQDRSRAGRRLQQGSRNVLQALPVGCLYVLDRRGDAAPLQYAFDDDKGGVAEPAHARRGGLPAADRHRLDQRRSAGHDLGDRQRPLHPLQQDRQTGTARSHAARPQQLETAGLAQGETRL